jgi:hypothetical protein
LLEIPVEDNIEKGKFSQIYQKIPFPSFLITIAAIILGWIVTFWPRIWLAPPLENASSTGWIYIFISLLWVPVFFIVWRKDDGTNGCATLPVLFVIFLALWFFSLITTISSSPRLYMLGDDFELKHCEIEELENDTIRYYCTLCALGPNCYCIWGECEHDCDFDCGHTSPILQWGIVFEGRKGWPFVWTIDVVEEPY